MHSAGTVKLNKRRIVAIFLAFAMGMLVFASCGEKGGALQESSEAAGTVIAEDESSLTIVDQAGREVEVKKNPESIGLCYRVVIRFLLNLEQGDKIKGIGKREDFFEMVQPSLMECANVGQGVVDIEALAELSPDLFIHKASDIETLEAVEKIGIPAIGIDVETPEDMIVAIDILGKVCGAEEKAGELIEYYDQKISESREKAESIKEKDRKTAIVMGTSIGKVADGSMLQGQMLTLAGARNCAEDMEATELWPTAGTEQIFEWNPDYIFITGSESALYDVEDIYKDKAWSEMKAVKNKHVYVIPSEADSWEFPGIVSTLGIDYMMHVMYPSLISEEELEENVNELYELSYRQHFERSELGY